MRHASHVKRDDSTHDEIITRLTEIERRQNLLATMITVFALLWAFSKLFPFASSLFLT